MFLLKPNFFFMVPYILLKVKLHLKTQVEKLIFELSPFAK